ncbi:MAG TPA: ATP-binding protein, partial [Candidatus Manganitrophaceae bacterium]|nr:ATP-binding protein [Candidatus Manganitrophaceae bacterium]
LNTALSDLLPLLGKMLGEQTEVVFSPDPNLKNVHADLAQVEQVVLNLCINARDAMPKGGRITLATKNHAVAESDPRTHPIRRPGDYVLLAVSDTGTGMDEKTLERIFEPFFSTKGPERGTGLGLSIVHGAVGRHGGWITVESRPGKGSTFNVFLPASEERRRLPADQGTAIQKLPRRAEKILVVEDDPLLRGVFEAALGGSGHPILLAENGEEGLRMAERHAGALSLIVSDMVMPKVSGREFYQKVQKISPGMKFLFISGYADLSTDQEWLGKNRLPLLLKPFSPAELVARVREILEPPLPETDVAA